MRTFSASCVLAITSILPAQVDYDGANPWSRTANSGPDAAVPGWWYNLGITGIRVELDPNALRELDVKYVFPGSPAAGVVQVGDRLTGAAGQVFQQDHQDGYGPAVFGAQGPISEFAVALAAAQTQAGGGNLQITLSRAGQSQSVTVPVGTTYGDFSATYPANCPKCDLILDELLDYLVATQEPNGSWGSEPNNTFAPLALMSSNDPQHQAALSAAIDFHKDTTTAKDEGSLINWRYMGAGLVLAEHYLITQDAALRPELQEIHDFLAWSQYLDMSQVSPQVQHSHPQDVPTTPEEQHGGWGHNPGFEGYGPIAMLTGQGALVFALLERCGIKVRRKKHDAAYEFLERGTGPNGYLWYGDDVGDPNSWADMGRTGASALANFLSPYSGGSYQADARGHADVIGTHPQSFPDTHGSPIMGMGYAAAAARFHGNNFRLLMDANKYWFTLAHCFDGTYYYQPNRDNAGYGSDSRVSASAVTAFIFSIPQQALLITGRP